MGFSCGKCSDTAGGIALAAVLAAIALVAVVFLVSYIVSGKLEGARRGFVNRIRQYVPFQSIKIVIVSWQILTQVRGDWSKVLCQASYSRQVGSVLPMLCSFFVRF